MESDTILYFSDSTEPVILKDITNMTASFINGKTRFLTEIKIGSNVVSIEDNCFNNCYNLKQVIIPNSVKKIGNNCFSLCYSLIDIFIDEGTEYLGNECFRGCFNLEELSLPDSITYIGTSCFQGCSKLTNIILSENLVSLNDTCFFNCISISKINIPKNVSIIGNEVFKDCINLKNIFFENQHNLINSGTDIFKNLKSPIKIEFNNTSNSSQLTKSTLNICRQNPSNPYINGIYYKYITINIVKNKEKDINTIFYFSNRSTTVTENSIITRIIKPNSIFSSNFNTLLVKVVLGENVTEISDNVFLGCTNLTEVVLSQSLLTIGKNAFSLCSSLNSVDIPLRVTKLGESCFSESININSITGGNGLEIIDNKCFSKCKNLSIFTIGENVKTIGNYCFEETQLKTALINKSVTTIGDYCFYNCLKLTQVNILSELLTISKHCFDNCILLSSVIFNESSKIKSFEEYCFSGCRNITKISIPNSVTNLSSFSFRRCFSLSEIIFNNPNGIITNGINIFNEIGNQIKMYFKGLTSLAQVSSQSMINIMQQNYNFPTIPITDPTYYIFDTTDNNNNNNNTLLTKITYDDGTIEYTGDSILTSESYSKPGPSVIKIEFGSTAIELSENAFIGCSNLANIVIETESNINKLGKTCFTGCANLTSVIIKNNKITTISSSCFSHCSKLKILNNGLDFMNQDEIASNSIIIPNIISYIDDYAFMNCESIEKVIFQQNFLGFGNNVFDGCAKLSYMSFQNVNGIIQSGTNNLINIPIPVTMRLNGLINRLQITSTSFINFTKSNSVDRLTNTVPTLSSKYYIYDTFNDTTKTIFYYISGDFIISDATILTNALITQDITTLIGVQIGTNVLSISNGCFKNCVNLKNIELPINVTIDEECFSGCTNMTSAKLSETITTLPTKCFYNCTNLKELLVVSNITSMGNYCFSGCTSIQNINISKLLEIKDYCFEKCENLLISTLSNTTTSLGEFCFSNCLRITSLIIPSTVTTIKNNCFDGSINLANLIFENCNNLTFCGTNLFNNLQSTIVMRLMGLFSRNDITSQSFITLASQNIDNPLLSDPDYYVYDALTGQIIIVYFNNNTSRIVNVTDTIASTDKIKIVSVEISTDITSIADDQFKGYNSLTSIQIPNGVSKLGKKAFSSCSKLTSITLPSSLQIIDEAAFEGCAITTIFIPKSVITLGNKVFSDCSSLLDIEFENCNTLTQVGTDIFEYLGPGVLDTLPLTMKLNGLYGEEDITSVAFNTLWSQNTGATSANYIFEIRSTTDTVFYKEDGTTIVVNDSSLETFDKSSIIRISIGTDVTRLDSFQYKGFTRLVSITIPDSVLEIGVKCFQDCISITNILFGPNVKVLDDSCFSGCSSLTEIFIPKSVIEIGNNCFENCSRLTKITFEDINTISYCGIQIFSGIISSITMKFDSIFSPLELKSLPIALTNQNPRNPSLTGSYYIYKTPNNTYLD